MREFRLVFAQKDSDGIPRHDVLGAICDSILLLCGGYTVTDGHGGYRMASGQNVKESIWIIDCGTDQGEFDCLGMAMQWAGNIKSAMAQESVYFRNVDGSVTLL